jgi:hypothetical protein
MLNNFDELVSDIASIKKDIKDIAVKVDILLEIMDSFTAMLSESDDDDNETEDYDLDESWVPKEDEFWEDDADESI